MIKLEVRKEESLWLRLKQTQEKTKKNILKSDLCYSWEDSHNLKRVRGRLFTLHSYVMGICTISLWYPQVHNAGFNHCEWLDTWVWKPWILGAEG